MNISKYLKSNMNREISIQKRKIFSCSKSKNKQEADLFLISISTRYILFKVIL